MKTQLLTLIAFLVGSFAVIPTYGQDEEAAERVDEEAPKDECVQIRRIDSWSAIDDKHILVRASRDEQYLLTFRTSCRGISRAHAIALSDRMGRLCPDDLGHVSFRDGGMRERCRVENVEQVADKEEAEVLVESRQSEE